MPGINVVIDGYASIGDRAEPDVMIPFPVPDEVATRLFRILTDLARISSRFPTVAIVLVW
jgi:hypothetical protein